MNKATVTQVRRDNETRSKNPLRCKVFVNPTKAYENAIDDFYLQQVRSLKFKSKAWAWLIRQRTKLVADALVRDVFGNDGVAKIQFSSKAGCSCGCSPGFIVDLTERAPQMFRQSNVWADIEVNNPDLNAKVLIDIASVKLVKELKQHGQV